MRALALALAVGADVPVYASDADALARTSARTASQGFVLPALDDTIPVGIGVSP